MSNGIGIIFGTYDVIIVGCGISGSVLAERFANVLNMKVLIVDKRDHIGGNCYDYIDENGILVSKYGAHIFHTNHDRVWNYVNKFSEWEPWIHKVIGSVDGKLVPIPVNISTVNILFDLDIKNESEMDGWLKENQILCQEPRNSEDIAKARVGEVLYEKIFKNYTFKQWAKYPEELEASVLQRIPVRNNFDDRYFTDKYQALPKKGYTNIFNNLLKSDNITVVLNQNFEDLRQDIQSGKFCHEYLFFTGPIDQYFTDLPKLEYRSLQFEKISIPDTEFFQSNSVINYPSSEFPYTRIIEYKHFLGQKSKNTTIIKEYSVADGDPYYPVPNKKNRDLYEQYRLLAQNEELSNKVYFIGRLANYKYFNMDEAVLNSLQLFDKIVCQRSIATVQVEI